VGTESTIRKNHTAGVWNSDNQENIHGSESGRFPANLITDGSEEVRECFPETKSGKAGIRTSDGFNNGIYGKGMGIKAGQSNGEFGDSGNASRFFKSIIYQAKASKSERNKGCEEIEK
jgi:transposase-like protein